MPKALLTYAAPAIVGLLSLPATVGAQGAQVDIPDEDIRRLDPADDLDVEGVLELLVRLANLLIAFVAVLAVIFIIVGGFKYVTSGGAEEKMESARNTIVYGLVGLAVALLAFALVAFVNSVVNTDF